MDHPKKHGIVKQDFDMTWCSCGHSSSTSLFHHHLAMVTPEPEESPMSYRVDDTNEDGRETYEIPVVVMVTVKGVDERDARDRATSVVAAALSTFGEKDEDGRYMDGLTLDSSTGDMEATRMVNIGHRIIARVTHVTSLANIFQQGFVGFTPTGLASKRPMM